MPGLTLQYCPPGLPHACESGKPEMDRGGLSEGGCGGVQAAGVGPVCVEREREAGGVSGAKERGVVGRGGLDL